MIANDLRYIVDRSKEKDERDAVHDEWKALARIIDHIFFLLTVSIVLITSAIFVYRPASTYLSEKETNLYLHYDDIHDGH